jgi:hypothetical protein
MLQKEDARRTTVHREKWKRKVDVGDVVHLAVHYSEAAHKSLVGLDGSTVLSIDGEWLTLSSGDDNRATYGTTPDKSRDRFRRALTKNMGCHTDSKCGVSRGW